MLDVDESESVSAPKQVIYLAAGRGVRLVPYTDSLPVALVDVGGLPLIAHSINAFRRQGAERFIVCRGWKSDKFDDLLHSLGHGVELVECPDFETTGMLASLRRGVSQLNLCDGFYIAYGDIIYRPSVARKLTEAEGEICAVINMEKPGNQSKGFQNVEVVACEGTGASRVIRRIGKNRKVPENEIDGEFGGLVKVSLAASRSFLAELERLNYQNKSFRSERFPWWLEPLEKASLCDFLQFLVDTNHSITPVTIFSGWHELNSPLDLIRARNDTATFLSEDDARSQVAAMGACLLSEANDLKRPLNIVAQELNISLAKLEALVHGDLEVDEALEVLRIMCQVYPVPLNDLWLDADDTVGGVRYCSAKASESSSRILSRSGRGGIRSPYYEYRDAAMSRCSQFRPEWIKQLRIVRTGDSLDPDVQMNNGHLMMQTTLFIGPVDFYWKDRHGRIQRREMNTGDSNFISPFVPHSFTSRDPTKEAVIVAVTYGGHVRRAFTEFVRIGAESVQELAGDTRDLKLTRSCMLKRHMAAESLDVDSLTALLNASDANTGSEPQQKRRQALRKTAEVVFRRDRVQDLVEGEAPTLSELDAVAEVLNLRVKDLIVTGMSEAEEVVVTHAADLPPEEERRNVHGYVMRPLARTRHQPDLKTFDIEVLDEASPGGALSCGLHAFVYSFGSEPIAMSWRSNKRGHNRNASHTIILEPGDSAYIAPCVEHSFSVRKNSSHPSPPAGLHPLGSPTPAKASGRRLLLVRIPGQLSGETLSEFATFSADGRKRVGAENQQWYRG